MVLLLQWDTRCIVNDDAIKLFDLNQTTLTNFFKTIDCVKKTYHKIMKTQKEMYAHHAAF